MTYREDMEIAFKNLCREMGKIGGKWVLARQGGSYRIEEIDGGGVWLPFGYTYRTPKVFADVLWYAVEVLRYQKREREV